MYIHNIYCTLLYITLYIIQPDQAVLDSEALYIFYVFSTFNKVLTHYSLVLLIYTP